MGPLLRTELGQLTELTEVSNNQLTGSLPTELGLLLSSLIWLQLGNNLFTGTIPTELGQLTALRFSNNRLTGAHIQRNWKSSYPRTCGWISTIV